jgi:hypothetical protein
VTTTFLITYSILGELKMTNKELTSALETATNRIKELEEKLAVSEKIAATLQTAPAVQPSKSRQQAEKVLALLKAGPVTVDQLKTINSKYPSDPVYFLRSILKQEVVTHRQKDGKTSYSLPDASTQKEDATKDASKEPGTEEKDASTQKEHASTHAVAA